MKRKLVIAVLAGIMGSVVLCGCSKSSDENTAATTTEKAVAIDTEISEEKEEAKKQDAPKQLSVEDVANDNLKAAKTNGPASVSTKKDNSSKKTTGKVDKNGLGAGDSSSNESADAYASEITGLPISNSIKNQRPIAVMVDNDERALPHYGISEADVVYEMMNSTANNRITRLMCVYKDWKNVPQIGSIRSTRSTNPMLTAEWNAVLIHDGGPYYINTYLSQPWARHLSGNFTRVSNGKAREFTEYVMNTETASRIKAAGYSESYDNYKNEDDTHFNFGSVDLSYGIEAKNIKLPFPHNSSQLKYNTSAKTYDYYEYGSVHKDAEDNETLSFENVILQDVDFAQLDENGYLIYNVIGEGTGYYITEGYAIPIFWRKASETDITRFYNSDNKEITINKGKTYIGLVPSDSWGTLSLN